MTLKTTMSVLIAIILLPIVAGDAFAEIDTPYKQFKNGIPIEDIQCRDSKILMETPRGMPACVSEKTANKMNWKIIETEFIQSDITSSEQASAEQASAEQASAEQASAEQASAEKNISEKNISN